MEYLTGRVRISLAEFDFIFNYAVIPNTNFGMAPGGAMDLAQ